MRDGPFFGILAGIGALGLLVAISLTPSAADVRREVESRKAANCATLYGLADTKADTLAIARDGCAAYMGKEGTE